MGGRQRHFRTPYSQCFARNVVDIGAKKKNITQMMMNDADLPLVIKVHGGDIDMGFLLLATEVVRKKDREPLRLFCVG